MKNLAPIGISTYNRLEHLKKTVAALKKNNLSGDSVLYIFSDAPKSGDEASVKELRRYLKEIDGFEKVVILERQTNGRTANIRGGVNELLERYGKMIFLEDDVVTSKYFLEFMNEGLDKFYDNKEIFGLNGFNVPGMKVKPGEKDYYISRLMNGWGWATWVDRNFAEIIKRKDAYMDMKSNGLVDVVNEIHPNLYHALEKIYKGELDAGDYKMTYHLIKEDMFFVRPIESFTKSIGWDGSGVHCGVSNRFETNLLDNKIDFGFGDIPPYEEMKDKKFFKFFNPPKTIVSRIKTKLINLIKRILG